jgi:ABC-type uncharacterized transport system substrate-binding protein
MLMFEILKRLSLGTCLLAMAAGVLLHSDKGSRLSAKAEGAAKSQISVALVQHASLVVLDEGVDGMLTALAARGYEEGKNIKIRRYNSEGDIGTANTIAREVTTGDFDLILTASTVSLQTVANANRNGARTRHVFGIVTDPYAAGVGIDPSNHLNHPPYMTGAGSIQPVEQTFRIAKRMNPGLKSVGLVWNAAEVNSMVQTKLAREICAELGIQLIEGNAENSTAVVESVNSVIARGAECLWISGDVAVSTATDQVINACRRARIPVFTVLPPAVKSGALFDLGANYFDIGKHTGEIAADVLDGKNPAEMPVDNYVPVVFLYNETALTGLKDRWTIPADLKEKADGFITATEIKLPMLEKKAVALPLSPQPGRVYKIGLAYFAPESAGDECRQGIVDGLKELGFLEGKNLEIRMAHAQAEIANIPGMLQNFDSSEVDLVLPMSTPVISAAVGFVKHKPIVFTYCSDPIAAGAGVSFTDHLPNVTGIGSFPPVQAILDAIQQTMPGIKSVGTIYNNSEANSVKVVSVERELFAKAGITLEEVTVSSPADVLPAAQALSARGIKALCILDDNTVAQAMDAVIRVARDSKLPLFAGDGTTAGRGPIACVGLGYYQPGYAVAKPVARVLLGESPATIPIENVIEKQVFLDEALARQFGLTFPPELKAEAARQSTTRKTDSAAVPPNAAAPAPLGRLAKLNLIEFLETPNVEINRKGIQDGLAKAGLVEGRDYELVLRNAQGDMAALNTIMDAAASDGSELLITATTPALQVALQRAAKRPVIFSLVGNPMEAGAGRTDQDHLPNVTGAYVNSPHSEGLTALRRCLPNLKRVGTLFVPSEVNSVYYKDELLKAASALGIEVELVGVSTSGEIADAALALCSRNIDAVCQISDNLTGASFASIVQAANRARLPLMGFASGQAESGAFLTVSRDFYDGGLASAAMAARILRGESPAVIPFQLVAKINYEFNQASARSLGITIPKDLLQLEESVH